MRAESLKSHGKPYKRGDRVRYKLNNDTRSKKGGKIAPRYSEEYEVVEVLGDGYTYNLKAVNHNGRAKSRHFNLLKTVHRSEEVDDSKEDEYSENEQRGSSTVDIRADEDSLSNDTGSPFDTNTDPLEEETNLEQTKWVRRSTRDRKQRDILQADGKKKTYSSTKAIDIDDSE